MDTLCLQYLRNSISVNVLCPGRGFAGLETVLLPSARCCTHDAGASGCSRAAVKHLPAPRAVSCLRGCPWAGDGSECHTSAVLQPAPRSGARLKPQFPGRDRGGSAGGFLSVRRDTGALSVREALPAVEGPLPARSPERDGRRAGFPLVWRGGDALAAPCGSLRALENWKSFSFLSVFLFSFSPSPQGVLALMTANLQRKECVDSAAIAKSLCQMLW